MTEDERWFAAKTLLLKIHTITGWTIPLSELMDILIDQFQRKLQESYSSVTIAEIEYAFRNRDIDMKDWGKSLNLTLIDEIMLPYLATRYDLSISEESMRLSNTMVLEEKKELSDEEWDEWIEDMKKYDLKLLPCTAYDYLTKKGEISLTNQQKHEYMDRAIAHLLANFEPGTKEMLDYLNMKKQGVYSAEITSSLITISKRFALSDYLKK